MGWWEISEPSGIDVPASSMLPGWDGKAKLFAGDRPEDFMEIAVHAIAEHWERERSRPPSREELYACLQEVLPRLEGEAEDALPQGEETTDPIGARGPAAILTWAVVAIAREWQREWHRLPFREEVFICLELVLRGFCPGEEGAQGLQAN